MRGIRTAPSLDERIATLREAIRYDRLFMSWGEAQRQLKGLLAEKAIADREAKAKR